MASSAVHNKAASSRHRYNNSVMSSGQIPETITELSQSLRTQKISPVEITQSILQRIERLNPQLNVFITVTPEAALAAAGAAESEIASGKWRGPLHGVPVALKDLIDAEGIRTTAASALHKDRIPATDAEVTRRLKDAGAVIIGKNNLHEFAYGGSSLVSHFGDVHNPWDVNRVAGGSSGGSAAAVVAGLCYAAIGTDTAGSIREPASLCGCVGLKPTYGRVSSRGVIPLSQSLDHVGPLANSIGDAAIVLQAIAGYDAADITSCNLPVRDYVSALEESTKLLRVGVPRAYFFEDLDPETAEAVERALRVIHALVADMREIELTVPTDRVLQTAESYAYHEKQIALTPELFQPETLKRIRRGEKISASEYVRARNELMHARREVSDIFLDVDLIVTPATPMPAPEIRALKADPENLRPAELRLLRNTRPFNVWGLPAISLPCGFTKEGLPMGLQIAGPHWREDRVLCLAHSYQQTTEWHKRRPNLKAPEV